MTISDKFMIGAVILGPILAVQVQKLIEGMAEKKNKKKQVFSILMATRATPVAPLHVEALNRIDIDFYDDKKVKAAWNLLRDNFNHCPKPEEEDFKIKSNTWAEKSIEFFNNLLNEMGRSLGYKFDVVDLKRNAYYPKGHGDLEDENYRMRQAILKILAGENSFPVKVVNSTLVEGKIGKP